MSNAITTDRGSEPAAPIVTPARTHTGLTIREEFVKAAMQGLAASGKYHYASDDTIAQTNLDMDDTAIAQHALWLARETLQLMAAANWDDPEQPFIG